MSMSPQLTKPYQSKPSRFCSAPSGVASKTMEPKLRTSDHTALYVVNFISPKFSSDHGVSSSPSLLIQRPPAGSKVP